MSNFELNNKPNLLNDLLGDYQYSRYLLLPDSRKYKALTTGLDENEKTLYYYDSADIYRSYKGILNALKYFTYWDYVRNLNAKTTSVGIRFADAENSVGSTQLQVNSVIEQRYNLGVDDYKKACELLNQVHEIKLYCENINEDINTPGLYHITFSIIQNNEERNSVNLCSLINDEDLIEIGGKKYEVETIAYNTFAQCDVTFFADTGLTFNEKHIVIDPFVDYITQIRHYSVLDGML